MDVLGRAVWQKKPIVDLKVAPATNGLVDQGFVMKHVLRCADARLSRLRI